LRLNYLELNSFRNIKDQRVDFPSRVTVIVGKNGQGKTSLLEAAYILSHAKSFRSSKPSELVSWSSSTKDCLIRGGIEAEIGSRNLSYGVKKGKKEVLINEQKAKKAKDYYGQLKSVEFTPDDLKLVSGAPLTRRQFFDRVISQIRPNYVENLVRYHKALKQRNSLLSLGENDLKKFQVWNKLLIEHGLEVSRVREEVILEFKEYFTESYNFFTGYDEKKVNEEVSQLSYSSTFSKLKDLEEKYTQSFPRDLRTRTTNLGIHRDDYLVDFNPGDGFRVAKSSTSQGQKRSIALAIKFAAVKFIQKHSEDEAPILLLDDVESELDRFRKKALFWKIAEIPSQVIITATEISAENIKALGQPTVMEISEGSILQ